jgi:hypothetical protein
MQEGTGSQPNVPEGLDRPDPWDTCFNVAIVCPGCLKSIRPCAGAIHSCDCQDVLWRRHPVATGKDVPWQALFLDFLEVC